ncbi:MAG TPA: S53 family peptidase [Bryobacteraceae bacterium]|nr:S53 family peptidase [Bryobacteraceae bacterium]
MPSSQILPVLLLGCAVLVGAQTPAVPTLITSTPNEAQLVRLTGNTHPLARSAVDRGAAPATLPMERMLLVLKRSAEQDAALTKLLTDQQTPASPDYHRWLTPQEFGRRFGISDQDLKTVTDWLQARGFSIDYVSNGRTVIEFSGNVSQVQNAFHTAVHQFVVNGEPHWANVQDPELPAALAPAVAGVASLNNFFSKPQLQTSDQQITAELQAGSIKPLFTSGSSHYLAPSDYDVIYNINPLLSGGINGSGIVIGVVGRTNINVQDVVSFRSIFGLPVNAPNIIVNGRNPGDLGGSEELEAVLDTSWSGAVAPRATVDLVVSASTNNTDGVTLSEEYIIDNNLANVMTESFGSCEANYTASGAAAVSSLAQQAAAEGITYLVSSGDAGSAGCDDPNTETSATGPLSVNALASSPYTIAVGGTQFNEAGGTYWSSANGGTLGSAVSYIPEDVWNANCTGSQCGTGSILAGGGGASVFFPKPTWQAGVAGIPNDGARDVPDVSLTAALHDAYLLCVDGSCTPNSQGQIQLYIVGGTSASTPAFAGIMALVNQKTGSRQGQADPMLYGLAASETLSNCNGSNALPATTCIFNDVTTGTNAVPGEANYNTGSETYAAGVGYDRASGLGSVNVTNLVNGWNGSNGGGGGNSITVNPSAGSGSTQTFTFTYTSTNQVQDHFFFNSSLTGNGACYLIYDRPSNNLYIANDQGNAVTGSVTPGGSGILSSSQCTVPGSSASASISGNTITITATVIFAPTFAGQKNIYTTIVDTSYVEGTWQQIGTWMVTAPDGNSMTVNPSSGSGSMQRFTFAYTSTNQAQEHFFFNSSLTGNGACYLIYDRSSNNLYIANDQGTAVSQSVTPGGSGILASSQCTVPASSASVSLSGNTVTITATITFAPSFTGAKNIYANISDTSYVEGTWQQIGTWTP